MKHAMGCFSLLFLAGQPLWGEVVSDSFDGTKLNAALWAPWFVNSPTGSVAQADRQLTITGQSAGIDEFEAGVRLRGTIGGNFDVQIGYTLRTNIDALAGGKNPRVGIGWSIGRNNGSLVRSAANGAGFLRYDFGSVTYNLPFVAASGRLRVTRNGPKISAYYWIDGVWRPGFESASPVDGLAELFLFAGMDSTGTISASFDGFYLEADRFDPEVPATTSIVLPHLAAGGPWTTELIVCNPGDQPSAVTIRFYGDDGQDLALPISGLGNVSTVSAVVPAHATSYYAAADSAGPERGGWGLVSASAPVSVQAIFRGRAPSGIHYEAAVPSNPGGLRFVMPFDATTFAPTSQPLYTAIALANLDTENAATVTCVARDESGATIPNGISIPEIPPRGHYANYLFANLTGRRGTFECTSNGMISALGLRAVDSGAFSTLPVHWK